MGSLRAGGAPVYPAGGFGDNHKTDYLRSGRRSCAAFGDLKLRADFSDTQMPYIMMMTRQKKF
jgi:hypothetical protein